MPSYICIAYKSPSPAHCEIPSLAVQAIRGDAVPRDIQDATAASDSEAAMALDTDGTLLQLLPEGGDNPERNLRAAARLQLQEQATRLIPGR